MDELLRDVDPKKVFSSEGLLTDIKTALAERMLNAELDQHLYSEAATTHGVASGNHRYSKKTVPSDAIGSAKGRVIGTAMPGPALNMD